ncbi:MAG: hypothetical protein PHO24_06880 [Clostridia bacterium]|nr:hypothetical protein [Clostridia bacterium]
MTVFWVLLVIISCCSITALAALLAYSWHYLRVCEKEELEENP